MIPASNNLEEKEKVADSKKDKNKNKSKTKTESEEETSSARQIPSRRKLSSGGLLRKSQKSHDKRPSLFRSFTSDALFSSRRKKVASTGCGGHNVTLKGESHAVESQDSRERRHSTPIDTTPLQNDSIRKSEVNQDAPVFPEQVGARQVVKLPAKQENTANSVQFNGDSHDFYESSNVAGMKRDRDNRDRRAKSLPVNFGVHDPHFVTDLAGVVDEKSLEIQQTSHDIFRRNTQYRNPIKRDKQARRQSLPVFLNPSVLREEFENELKSQGNFPKDDKLESGTNITEKGDTYSKSTLKEDRKSPRTTALKGFKSSLLERFLEQKEVDEVDFNEQREAINQEKIILFQNIATQCRRFSLPSRLEGFYGGDDKKGESRLNDELFGATINCQDPKTDLGNVSQNTNDTTQQDFKSKKNTALRSNSLPSASTNIFSKIISGYRQKEPLLSNSDSLRRTKSLPKLAKSNDINMEIGHESKRDYTSAESSLIIECATQEVHGDTLENINQLGMFSATRSNSLPLDIDKSISTSATLNSDLDDEIQEITKCVESVIQGFYKNKEQCGQPSISHSNEELTQVKTCNCTNSLPLNTNCEVSTESDIEIVEKEEQIGLENLTTTKDLENYSEILIPSGNMGRDGSHENVDKIVLTRTERSPKTPTSQGGNVPLDQTNNYMCDCATTVNGSTPVEFSKSGDKSAKLLLSDDMTAEMEQEIHTEATEQRNEESSEVKPRAELEATEFTVFNLPKNKDETLIENANNFDFLEERKPVLQEGSPDLCLINDFSVQDQLSIENSKVKAKEGKLSNEKNESENLISVRDDRANKFPCVTENRASEQTSAAPRENDEKPLEEFPQFEQHEITSERAEVQKRVEEKSNDVENPPDILQDVIQSVLEELFCQVDILNKTDAIRDYSSSVLVDKSLIESSSTEHELEKTVDKKDNAQRELAATELQNDTFETFPSSGIIDSSEISLNHIIEPSHPKAGTAMIIPKQKKELQEKTSSLENKKSEKKVLSENGIILLEDDKEFDSVSVDNLNEKESEEFENEFEEILEKVNVCSDVIDGETASEDSFRSLDENVRADIQPIESDKGQGNDSICPLENGETGKLFSQAKEQKIASETVQPKQDVDNSFESCRTVAKHVQQPSEGESRQQDHANLPLVDVIDKSHKPVITVSASGSEVEKLEIKQDSQLPSELKTANAENSAYKLQESAVTKCCDLHLDDKKNRKIVEERVEERPQETVATVVSSNPEEMKLVEKDNITVKNDSNLSEELMETTQEKLNESAASIEAIRLPEIILPCEKFETIPEAPNAKRENKKEDLLSIKQENKEQLVEHAEKNKTGKLSNNYQEESNGRKDLKLKLRGSNSEGVDICDHGSPIDSLSQKLDAFDIPPFSRPRVYTLPLTNRMEKIVEAPGERSPDIERKEFPSVFSKGHPRHLQQIRRNGSLRRDVTKRKPEKTRRSLSAPSSILLQNGGKHDLYPLQEEEPEATELTFEDRMELFDKLLSNSLTTVLEPDYTRSKSPLHRAIAKERFDCVEFLIECGVDVNANDESGWPPLHVAVTSGCFDCAVLLVETGADLGGYTDLVMREYKRLRRQVYCRTV